MKPEEEMEGAGIGRWLALIGVIGLAAAMAALPVAAALGAAIPVQEAAVGLAGLVAVVGGVKLAATVWGLAAALD